MSFRLSQIPAPRRLFSSAVPHGWIRLVSSEPQLNKRADTNWRLRSAVTEVTMTVPGPALLALLWQPVLRSPLPSYSS